MPGCALTGAELPVQPASSTVVAGSFMVGSPVDPGAARRCQPDAAVASAHTYRAVVMAKHVTGLFITFSWLQRGSDVRVIGVHRKAEELGTNSGGSVGGAGSADDMC